MLFGSDHEIEAIDRMLNGEEQDTGFENERLPGLGNFVQKVNNTQLTEGFRWIDQHGEKHCVKEMTTQHIFFSLRMIWNHSAPIHMRIEPYKRYAIHRSVEYITLAVKHLYAELETRTDLQPYFIKCLRHMKECLEGHNRRRIK